ncbi:MAG: phosphoheptose isomerase [Nitrososphaerales archaeon]
MSKPKKMQLRRDSLPKTWGRAYMIDIDGVICGHVDNEFPEKMKTVAEIPGAKEWVNSKYDEGNYVCFFTARLEAHRKITETWLGEHGFRYHQIIFGKPRGGNYHYIDHAKVHATTFKGKFSPMVSVTHGIEVFDEE